MSKKKFVYGALGVTLLATLALAGCSKGSSAEGDLDKTLNVSYTQDPETLDYTVAMQTYTNQNTANFVDGLLTYDQYRQIKPSLAEKWSVSEDGKTYTYHIRKGVKWVDASGNTYATVKPSDWVTSLKHAADAQSEALYLVSDSVKGLQDYADGKDKDFSHVGIKADDKAYTLTYTLNNPETFWNSKTTYGILYPVNAEFLKEKGKDFGKVATDGLLYNGPFIPTKFDNKSEIDYKANPNYWDKKNVYIDNIKRTYYDGSKPEELYTKFKNGTLDEVGLSPALPYYKNVDQKTVYWQQQSSGTYYATFNFNRQTFNNSTSKTDAQKNATQKALLNKNFRQAFTFSIDKEKYEAQYVGADAATLPIRSTIVPTDFVQIDGKDYGTAVQKDLEAINSTWAKTPIAQGANGTYNPEVAKVDFAKAKAELKSEGVEISKENPIIIDAPVRETSQLGIAAYTSLKNSIETTLDGEVEFNIIKLAQDPYVSSTFSFKKAADADYDFIITGWSPDYQDPATYLNIFSPKDGDVFRSFGLDSEATLEGADTGVAVKETLDFAGYQDLLVAANSEFSSLDVRYEKFAKAEAYLLDNAYVVPINASDTTPINTRIVPFSGINSNGVGGTQSSYKYTKVQKNPVTTKEYNTALKAWKAKVAKLSKTSDK
jgi:oligopeptide transport system substrate-binding protein